MVLAAAGLKAGQEDYWIRQIAESRCEYLSGHGESPGQWYGARAASLGLAGVARDEQCRAMFAGKDPITGEQIAQPKWVADPRSKLPAGPLAERLRALAEERSIGVGDLAGSQVLAAEVRAVLGRREVKAETVERVARHILETDPRDIYGDAYAEAAKHAGRRVDDRDACFDLCFSDVKSGSLFYAGADEATRREYVAARQGAIRGALGWLEQHAVGVRRGHGGMEHLDGRGLLAIGYDHRTSREGDPQLHTHLRPCWLIRRHAELATALSCLLILSGHRVEGSCCGLSFPRLRPQDGVCDVDAAAAVATAGPRDRGRGAGHVCQAAGPAGGAGP